MAKKTKRKPLTQEQFEQLTFKQDWEVVELPQDKWDKIPNLPRPKDTFAVFVSGCEENSKTWNNIEHIAGCDVIAFEDNPKTEKGEGNINIYHCVFQKLKYTTQGYEYLMYYPFTSGSLAPHWSHDLDQLLVYFQDYLQD